MTLTRCRQYYAAGLAANLRFVALAGVALARVSANAAKVSFQVQEVLPICIARDRALCDLNGPIEKKANEIEGWERRPCRSPRRACRIFDPKAHPEQPDFGFA